MSEEEKTNTVKEPIISFESNEQLQEYLKEWQDRLFLNSWIIKADLVDDTEVDGDMAGNNDFIFEINSSHIRIVKANEDNTNRIGKFCNELTLVHELLHCKYNWLTSNSSYECVYTDLSKHKLIEEMAKSLIMAKYNLPFDWFKNF